MTSTPPLPLPLRSFSPHDRRCVSVLLTDIDDTLTSGGALPAVAYFALEKLRAAGLLVIPVTGRPAGWCDLIARLWPVDGVVGENGAFYYRYRRAERRVHRHFALDEKARAHGRERLAHIRSRVLREVPNCRVSADQPYRESDLAIDVAEDVGPLPAADIERIAAIFAEEGAQAKVSSIHVNGWYGDYDKLAMTRTLLAAEFGLDIDNIDNNARVAFIGDSPNDEPMFAFFHNSAAVANFSAFAERVSHLPRWITLRSGGEGFAEFADALLEARQP